MSQIFERLLSESEIDAEQMEQIREAIKFTEELFDGLGFCLSEKPDLLSQWRGYADDGQGFSIGFSKEYLEKLCKKLTAQDLWVFMAKVLYEPEEHQKSLEPTYKEILTLVKSSGLKRPMKNKLVPWTKDEMETQNTAHLASMRKLFVNLTNTMSSRYILKNKAFHEEAEWRIVSHLVRDHDEANVSFRAVGNRLIPYHEIQLGTLEGSSITEVYVGPKNITPNFVIEKMLKQNGFVDVVVKRSAASYR